MRVAFLLAALISAPASAEVPCTEPVGKRAEPCQPTIAERRRLLTLMRKANDEFDLYSKAKSNEGTLRATIGLADAGDLNEWNDSRNEMGIRLRRAQTAFKEAARLTGLYYGVAPATAKGSVAGGAALGASAEWQPRLQAEEDEVFEIKKRGRFFYQKYSHRDMRDPTDLNDDRPVDSAAMDDGTVLISIRLLKTALAAGDDAGDPSILAARLQLERTRFEAKTCFPNPLLCTFQRPRDITAEGLERRAIDSVLAISEQIGLAPGIQQDLTLRKAELVAMTNSRVDNPRAFLSPEESAVNLMDWSQAQERLRFIKAQRIRLNARLAARQRGETPPPGELRDALRDSPDEGDSVSTDACGQRGLWSGDVFFPPMPCPQELSSPHVPSPAIGARLPPPVPAATLPPPVRAVPSLSGLAERICTTPSAAHTQPFHDDYGAAWYTSDQDVAAMPKCQREVFQTLMKIRREGYSDYNSAYFQALAENLNRPEAPAFEPPLPEVDLPVPPGPGVPDCMRAEGRRCLRWR